MKLVPFLLALAWAGCAGPRGVTLTPEINPSFAHMGGGRICLVGADWAMEAWFDSAFPASGEATAAPSQCYFYRGRGIAKCFLPAAGPVNQLSLDKEKLPRSKVAGLEVTGCTDARFADGGTGRFSFSRFTVDGVSYAPMGPVTIDIRGPYP